ncbi:N,N-dimethylformamidase beta subunit family domain-containing protein [Achromobacter denitrificans]|uniref:N,N-dimethylformamidase beta subunit family domain-containing protein n=1 Tax=Achromobacter denitrificans TaxID=32002 RepID=UPI0014670970|nr:N,N-dimethylformamidase beta subunit family domain-containing protein [Achromobacter denitrificans]CAB3866304.1 N,N-dimethylformamidase beta subunit [Achromobacter denitrificans]
MHPPILGYVTPLSAQPGQTLSFRISSAGGQPFTARVLRIHCADPNPDGPGMQLEPVDFPLQASYAGREMAVHPGACALAALDPAAQGDAKHVELRLLTKPTRVQGGPQVLASLQDASAGQGVALALEDGEWVVLARQEPGAAPVALRTGLRAKQDRWQSVSLHLALAERRVTVRVGPAATAIPGAGPALPAQEATLDAGAARFDGQPFTHLCLGALWRGHPGQGYNGLIEAPALSAGGQASSLQLLAQWNLADAMQESSVPGAQPGMPALTLVNTPVRAVRSSRWSGLNLNWKEAPDEYAAMYFHADALTDCGWEESVSLRIPPGMPSGVYGLEVAHPEGSDTIPFYVTPAADGPRARVLFLAPTLTYQAYANHARGNYAGPLAERIAQWGAYPHNPDVVTQFGASTYNRHEDMAGISLSSRLRPILTMRPGYLTFPDPKGSGLRHFPADSHLTQWLREKGFDYDVITDEDLDDQGLDALRPYDVVLTGSHPEYHTRRMIEALVAYREGGGYLMYLGANGFYWKIARPAAAPHLLEIRRAEGGIRAWASEPGEYYHQLDGGYGGMWRRNGIAPQCTGGVGFAVQGGFEGIGYRRTPESYDPDVAWLFEGVEGETYGDFGLSGGGAAGFELDQVVPELGSPAYLKIVGISDGHGPSFRIAPEEILTWTIAASIPRKYEGVHAHMAVGVAEQGGGLFAAGSITFLGSLLHNGCNNNVSRIVENCLRQFLSISLAKRGADCAPL